MRCRGRASDSASPTAHRRANRGARRATDRKCHETPNRRTDTGTCSTARHSASGRVTMPASVLLVIAAVIGRIGEPVDMLVMQVGIVPIGVVIGDRRFCAIGIQPVYPPAFAILIAGDIGPCRLGVGCR